MASDIFFKIGDIKGESMDDKHKDEIEVLSWSWGVNQTGSMSTGSGGGTGKASFNDISFLHHVDKASPILAMACATGEHIKEALLTVRKAGKGQQEFYHIKLADLLISSVHQSGADGQALTENVSINFSKISFDYKPQKQDGTLGPAVSFKYDVKAVKQV
ncbi:MAG TPA: type VI secretion system tube protein Hcp [Burkholderiales bacterium]|jgi:type VI secretion system secreted protein Hcp|nr:type VI secretion system tube protein Hcp [Burkholderiales bacterium]